MVGEGDMVAVLGSNGAGKSTLNLAISGIVPAREGSIEFDGRPIQNVSPSEIVAAGLVHVPEGRRIFPNMSVVENLDLGSYRRASVQRGKNRERVFSMFPRLRERATQRAGTLSGGEQQMLAIGRGLMADPKLLILDEPSLGLSPLLVEEMFDLIRRLNKDGLAVLLVEQNVVQSLDIVNRAYVLAHGSFVMSGSAADIRSNADLKRAFLGL
jgi:branched-chain amino acid transport system ATP-binding protein